VPRIPTVLRILPVPEAPAVPAGRAGRLVRAVRADWSGRSRRSLRSGGCNDFGHNGGGLDHGFFGRWFHSFCDDLRIRFLSCDFRRGFIDFCWRRFGDGLFDCRLGFGFLNRRGFIGRDRLVVRNND
jgi:hypothetical protein